LVLAAMIASVLLFVQISGNPYLPGTDAYYYALQVDTWARTGHLRIPDPSALFGMIGLVQRSGLSTETSVVASICLSLFVLITASGLLITKLRDPWLWGICAVWLMISPSLLFIAVEFPKTLWALVAVPLAFWSLGSKWNPFLAPILLALGAVFHRSVLVLAVALAVALLISRTGALRTFRRSWPVVIGLGGVFLAGLWIIASGELQRVPALGGLPGVLSLFSRASLPWAIKGDLALSHIVLVLVTIRSLRKKDRSLGEALVPWALLIPAWLPIAGDEVFGLGERFALLSPFLAWVGSVHLLAGAGDTRPKMPLHGMGVPILLLALGMALVPFRPGYSHPQRLDPPNAVFDRIVTALEGADIPMLICRRDLHFYYKFKTRREAFSFEPEEHWDKKRIWRVVCGISADELFSGLPNACTPDDGFARGTGIPGYFLIREDCWNEFRKGLRWEDNSGLYDRVHDSWLNPSRGRPTFLYKKHKKDVGGEFPAFKY
jgi:hypothetical protein